MKAIQSRTSEVLENGSLLQMKDVALSKILAKDNYDSLNIACESEILKPMLYWADKQCLKNELLTTPANRRSMLNVRIFLIRFGAMNFQVFGKCLSMVKTGFFTDAEISDIVQCISLGADYAETRIAKPFRCDRRIRSAVIKRTSSTRNYSYCYETIYSLDSRDELSIEGFETKFVVSEIIYQYNGSKLDFVQTGNRVLFNKPLQFLNGQCSFKVKPAADNSIECYQVADDSDATAKVYIRAGRLTCISTIIFR